ncbi:MAG: class E sortase [Candidatus Methanomethyliaceae archaeon]
MATRKQRLPRRAVGLVLLATGAALLLRPLLGQVPAWLRMRQVVGTVGTEERTLETWSLWINPYLRGQPGASSTAVKKISFADSTFALQIPAIKLKLAVRDGLDPSNLYGAAAHDPATPFPGEKGLSIILCHRNRDGSGFWNLDKVSPGDEVIFFTNWGQFVYHAQFSVFCRNLGDVKPPDDGHWAALVTCHPPIQPTGFLVVLCQLCSGTSKNLASSGEARYPTQELPWAHPYLHGQRTGP